MIKYGNGFSSGKSCTSHSWNAEKAGQQGDGWLGNVEARDGQLAVRGMSIHQPLMRQTPDCDDDAIKLKRPDDRHGEGSL